jgi:hypothetical protein
MSYEQNIYPNYDKRQKPIYYIEFERGGKKGEFTLFRRQFMYTEEQLVEMEKNYPKDIFSLRMCNEVHPWNLFTAEYGKDGCVPDRKWIEWMVDALNEKVQKELDAQPKS